jgi:hypothetical protein
LFISVHSQKHLWKACISDVRSKTRYEFIICRNKLPILWQSEVNKV